MGEIEQRRQILELCRSCAASVYRREPSPEYSESVARLLFGTAAQESGLQWRRQRSCTWIGSVGGFGLWQVELRASVVPSMTYLAEHHDVLDRATSWLWEDPHAVPGWVDRMTEDAALWLLRSWDRFGCLMARLHYLRVAAAVPSTLAEQAAYWKHYYNTVNGAGTVEQYEDNWWRYCDDLVEGRV